MNAKVYFLVSFLILGVVSCNDSKKESVDEDRYKTTVKIDNRKHYNNERDYQYCCDTTILDDLDTCCVDSAVLDSVATPYVEDNEPWYADSTSYDSVGGW
jgi:hypothetical protein